MKQINIVKPFLPAINEVYDDFAKCLETGMVTNNSSNVRLFEEKLQRFLGCKMKPLAFCNGELALFSLIQAVKLKMGYKVEDSFDVLVPSFTFSGTVNAIVMNNLKPVFCDVDETLTIDITKCGNVSGIKLMVVVGAYGNLPDVDAVAEFAGRNNIYVIFDDAPAFASTFRSKYICNLGFSEIYSFHASKIFNTMEGGLAVTNDDDIHSYLSLIRDFGQYEKVRGNVSVPGLNSKMPEISAIVGLKNLEKIDFILDKRRDNINKYKSFFEDPGKQHLFSTMKVWAEVVCNYLYFPVILNEEATGFVKYLEANSIAVRRYYTAVHDLDFYRGKYKSHNLDYTDAIKNRVVAIPLHTIMEDSDINYIFEIVSNYFNL
jgi:dTDP-4-amino-4,6-dideoxygalactose transaminase